MAYSVVLFSATGWSRRQCPNCPMGRHSHPDLPDGAPSADKAFQRPLCGWYSSPIVTHIRCRDQAIPLFLRDP